MTMIWIVLFFRCHRKVVKIIFLRDFGGGLTAIVGVFSSRCSRSIVFHEVIMAYLMFHLPRFSCSFHSNSGRWKSRWIFLRFLLLFLLNAFLAAKVDRSSGHSKLLSLLILRLWAPISLSWCLLVCKPGFMNVSKFSVHVKHQILILIWLNLLHWYSVQASVLTASFALFRRRSDQALATHFQT